MRKLFFPPLLAVAATAGLIIGYVANTGVQAQRALAVPEPALAIPNPADLSTAFAQIAKQVEPSVVKITSTYEERPAFRGRRLDSDDGEGESPNDLFHRYLNPFGGGNPNGLFRRQPMGSGVIVGSAGYILTNNHVVEKAQRIQVKLHGNPRMYEAKLIGADTETDLAVIRVDVGDALVPAKIGNSDGVEVGDWAIAIGSPFGLDRTVTAGIISAKARDLGDPRHQLQRFLQTDAAINPGNSGGPLLNARGQVIGINTAIATESGGYQGIGFALPINLAAKVYNDIITTGKVSRGAIGISFSRENKPELLKAYGASQGVFVQEAPVGGPAAKAGIQAGDIITAIGGNPVKDAEDLLAQVAALPVGSHARISVLRDEKKMDFDLTVADRAEVTRLGQAAPAPTKEPVHPTKVGFSARALNDRERQKLQLEEDGVLVTGVEPGSFAEDIGLAQGDIITRIDRQPVRSPEDLNRIEAALRPGKPVAFRVLRRTGEGWQRRYLAGTLR